MTKKIRNIPSRAVLAAQGSFVLALAALLVFWVLPKARLDDIRYVIRDARSIMANIQAHFRDEQNADPKWVMPDELPDSIIARYNQHTGSKEPYTQFLIDPFNQRKDRPKLKGKARTRDFVSRISGCKLSYIRIHDDAAIVYSYGPDGDDDTSRVSVEKLMDPTREQVGRFFDTFSYDVTNGTISDGDLVFYLRRGGFRSFRGDSTK